MSRIDKRVSELFVMLKRGIHVTEVTPHHLLLTEDDVPGITQSLK